jgi:hypothetical protein
MMIRSKTTRIAALALGLSACGLGEDPPEPATGTDQGALNGYEGMFEFAIDVPWRIEPRQNGTATTYDPVPINISIFDEDTDPMSPYRVPATGAVVSPRLGDLCDVQVTDFIGGTQLATTTYLPGDLQWIEKTGADPTDPTRPAFWPYERAPEHQPPPWRGVCHPATEDCTGYRTIRDTSEWHGLLLLNQQAVVGKTHVLKLVAHVSHDVGKCGSATDSPIALTNWAQFTYAPAALPRFDDRWLYGDLHYHSQGTDNEGESGYSYRAVAQAMGAMGLDFAFATDHASDSEQIVDVDVFGKTYRGLRDMNQQRFDAGLGYLHGVDGANHEVAATWPAGRPRVPRLFLGGEVDVEPEIAVAPTVPRWALDPRGSSYPKIAVPPDDTWFIHYGDGQTFDLKQLCDSNHWTLNAITTCPEDSTSADDLKPMFMSFPDRYGHDAFVPMDFQGFGAISNTRQHLLYLPRFPDQPTGFVASNTAIYGGAQRHLIEDLGKGGPSVLAEIKDKNGIAFFAHPLSNTNGGPGPGMTPVSQYEYEKIFDQQSYAGLEFWNEDTRLWTDIGDGDAKTTGFDFVGVTNDGSPGPGWASGSFEFVPQYDVKHWRWAHTSCSVETDLHNGAWTWDRMLRWGLDSGRTRAISWLPSGEPRRLFMAGGSDAHGDFSYRRDGYMQENSKMTDTAIAKVRNLVFAGTPRNPCPLKIDCNPPTTPVATTHSQDQVVAALADGRFAVTDGPALRVVIDRNRNGLIDDSDLPMGSIADLYGSTNLGGGEDLPLIVEWQSTEEFGPVSKIDLYVGVDGVPVGSEFPTPNEGRARTYAALDHGVRRRNDSTLCEEEHPPRADNQALECAVGAPCQMQDGYWRPATTATRNLLHWVPSAGNAYHGTWSVSLHLDDFPTNASDSAPSTRAYVRAFAATTPINTDCASPDATLASETRHLGRCVARYAFTNPVWALRRPAPAANECPYDDRALDKDLDGVPDFCDPFPTEPARGAWTRLFGGALDDYDATTAINPAGDAVFVAGTVQGLGRIEGGPAAGAQPLSASGFDGVIARYDRYGNLTNKLVSTGSGYMAIGDMAVDSNGDVYAVGTITGAGAWGASSLSSVDADPWVVKLRGSDLAVLWAHALGGTGAGEATKVAVTPDGRVIMAGDFTGALISGTFPTLTSDGSTDCFYSVWKDNTLLAIKKFGGTGACSIDGAVADSTGRAYLVGNYTGAVTVGTTPRAAVGYEAFLTKIGTQAEGHSVQWTSWLVGTSQYPGDAAVGGVGVDAAGNAYVAGIFRTAMTYAAPSGTSTLSAYAPNRGWDAFVTKVSPAGVKQALSLPSFGGPADEAVRDIAVAPDGSFALAGTFLSAKLTIGGRTLTKVANQDGFVARFDAAGNPTTARNFGRTGNNRASGLTLATDGRLLFSGVVSGTARIDDTRDVTSSGGWDGFLTSIAP